MWSATVSPLSVLSAAVVVSLVWYLGFRMGAAATATSLSAATVLIQRSAEANAQVLKASEMIALRDVWEDRRRSELAEKQIAMSDTMNARLLSSAEQQMTLSGSLESLQGQTNLLANAQERLVEILDQNERARRKDTLILSKLTQAFMGSGLVRTDLFQQAQVGETPPAEDEPRRRVRVMRGKAGYAPPGIPPLMAPNPTGPMWVDDRELRTSRGRAGGRAVEPSERLT